MYSFKYCLGSWLLLKEKKRGFPKFKSYVAEQKQV